MTLLCSMGGKCFWAKALRLSVIQADGSQRLVGVLRSPVIQGADSSSLPLVFGPMGAGPWSKGSYALPSLCSGVLKPK